jgi:putative colanic acid biosynthesis UDP-glucose lipid carrier transferase
MRARSQAHDIPLADAEVGGANPLRGDPPVCESAAVAAASDATTVEWKPDAAQVEADLLNTAAARRVLKRVVDIVVASLVLVFIFPLLIVVAAAIVADSRGSVLFVQRRTGLGGKAIRVIKFRTMSVKEDGEVIRHAGKGDQRVTKVGAFLRRSSIDELPQLWNVLRGDMSLVGPRPHALAHDQYYGALVPGYIHRFRVRPGITGLAQVSGYRGEIRDIQGMEGRVAADNRYIDTWSLWLDAKILLKTAVVTPFQTSAY